MTCEEFRNMVQGSDADDRTSSEVMAAARHYHNCPGCVNWTEERIDYYSSLLPTPVAKIVEAAGKAAGTKVGARVYLDALRDPEIGGTT